MDRSLLIRSVALAAVLTAAFGGQHAVAATPEFQLTPRVGYGSMRIDAPSGINEDTTSKDTVGLGVTGGYVTAFGLVGEIGADYFGHVSFLSTSDTFELTEKFISVGYQAELGNGWRVVPKVGRARWTLDSKEGWVFNPGPEESQRVKGYGNFWEVSLGRRISTAVALGLTYRQSDYDFGRTRSTVFGVTIGF